METNFPLQDQKLQLLLKITNPLQCPLIKVAEGVGVGIAAEVATLPEGVEGRLSRSNQEAED